MESELCQLCERDTTTGRAAPWGEGWICGDCLNSYGNHTPYDVLDELPEVLNQAAQWIAVQTGATDADAKAIQLARRVLKSPTLTARLKSS